MLQPLPADFTSKPCYIIIPLHQSHLKPWKDYQPPQTLLHFSLFYIPTPVIFQPLQHTNPCYTSTSAILLTRAPPQLPITPPVLYNLAIVDTLLLLHFHLLSGLLIVDTLLLLHFHLLSDSVIVGTLWRLHLWWNLAIE